MNRMPSFWLSRVLLVPSESQLFLKNQGCNSLAWSLPWEIFTKQQAAGYTLDHWFRFVWFLSWVLQNVMGTEKRLGAQERTRADGCYLGDILDIWEWVHAMYMCQPPNRKITSLHLGSPSDYMPLISAKGHLSCLLLVLIFPCLGHVIKFVYTLFLL